MRLDDWRDLFDPASPHFAYASPKSDWDFEEDDMACQWIEYGEIDWPSYSLRVVYWADEGGWQ